MVSGLNLLFLLPECDSEEGGLAMMAASAASDRGNGVSHKMRAFAALALGGLIITGAGCGSSGGSSGSSQPTAEATLWVANEFGNFLSAFAPHQLKSSGSPDPHAVNQSASINQPEGVIFDKHENMWVTNCSDAGAHAGTLQEYTREQIANLGHNPQPSPAVTLVDDGYFDIFDCPYGEEFDSSGNLWVSNRFNSDLIQFTPEQLKAGGVEFPNTEIDSAAFYQPEDIKFDSMGTLWIADIAEGQVDAFTASTLALAQGTTSTIPPDIVNTSTSLVGPRAIAFDKQGNQWVANCITDTLVQFAASDLTTSGSPTPMVIISSTIVTVPSGTAPSLDCPDGLAFDKHGNLWVSNGSFGPAGSLAKFTPSQISSSGSPTPTVFIDVNSGATNLSSPSLISFGPTP
jgi:sugar lactone lactonase YvrE